MRRYQIYLSVLIIAHFLLFFFTGLFRHWGFLTSINDLGVFDQAIWGTLNGEFLLNTSQLNERINWLSFHFHPILLIFLPFYFVHSSVVWLIAGQAFAISITAWPVFLLAKCVMVSEIAALLWAVIFLVNPFVLNAAAWDFHPITMAVPFVALGMLAVELKKFKLLLLCSLFILLCKEHLGIMVFGFGLLWWVKNKEIKKGLLLGGIGLLNFYLVLKVIMPYFSPTGKHLMLSEGMGQLSRYSWLGESVEEIIRNSILRPFEIMRIVLFRMGGAIYLFTLIFPFLGFSVLGWKFLLPGIADLASNMLSLNPMPRSIISYHSVSLIPISTIASLYGVKKIGKITKKFTFNQFTGMILVASCTLGYLFAPIPLPAALNFWAPISFVNLPDTRIKEIKSILGDGEIISVQSNIGAHFSQRKEIYRFPQKISESDAIILWLATPTKNLFSEDAKIKLNRKHILGMLDSHLQMDRNEFLGLVEKLLIEKNYGIIYWDDPWLVLKRGALTKFDILPIRKKIEILHSIYN